MSKYDTLLSLLEGVHPAPPQGKAVRRARAFCPCHQRPPHRPGRGKSLAITETDDGTILVRCHGPDCDAADVMAAVGLDPADLFPSRSGSQDGGRKGIGTSWMPVAGLVERAAELAAHLGELDDSLELLGLARQIKEAGREALRSLAPKKKREAA